MGTTVTPEKMYEDKSQTPYGVWLFAYLRFLPNLPVGFEATFFGGALGAGFFPAGFAGAFAAGFPAGLPLAGALGGGAV